MLLIKNANVYAPESLGIKDLLIANGSIQAIENNIEKNKLFSQIWDAQEKIVTPGIIDQHVHIIGAGGKNGFHSMTPEIKMTETPIALIHQKVRRGFRRSHPKVAIPAAAKDPTMKII